MNNIEQMVCEDILRRQQVGLNKYGRSVAQASAEEDMLVHAYQEALDLAIYLKAEIEERKLGHQ